MSVQDKRDRVDALREQIEERKTAHGLATNEANDSVREQVLDREIDRLEAELAALGEVPEPTGELSEPVAPGNPEINLAGSPRKDELVEMAQSLGIDTHGMTKDEVTDAIREASGLTDEEGNG